MTTPPFTQDSLPHFQHIDLASIQPTIIQLIENNKENLKTLLSQPQPYTWDNLLQPLEEAADELNKVWSPISHLQAVVNSDELRQVYNTVLPLLTDYYTEISQNEELYKAVLAIAPSDALKTFNSAQRKIIENDLRDFKLAGIHLSLEKKSRLQTLQNELTQLMTKFSENLLDATQAWHLHITDKEQLRGLPPQALQLAIDHAKQRHLEGYVITLDYPSYSTAIKFLENRTLRQQLYEAYVTRASDCGPNAYQFDNSPIMDSILKIRHEIATLVGFDNYATYSLATKMAKTPEEVLKFLNDLLDRSKPIAKKEYAEVAALAKKIDGIETLETWDLSYYSEKLQQAEFDFTQEDLRPYFPAPTVLKGLFSLVNKIYGLSIIEQTDIEVWHPDVKFYAITDENNELRGGFYIDLYARPNKRDGAWMDECRTRKRSKDGAMQYSVAYLTCNFMPPVNDKPALLTHDDVLTLFHEFGHCLHHILTKVDYPSVAGINGVPWDAVEFPSQFMESYCWEKESLDLMAAHYQTGAPLPHALYKKMLAAKHFQTGLQMIRQLEFSLFDFYLHLEYNPSAPVPVQTVLDRVRAKSAIVQPPAFNRFQHSFSHIFAGSYGAGYYSYKWAEVLSADAYAQFEENGLFDRKTGRSFMENILEIGGVRDPMQSFIAFRGREPHIDALLKQSGMAP